MTNPRFGSDGLDNWLTLDKLELTRANIDAALILYFGSGHPFAVYTLAHAAQLLATELYQNRYPTESDSFPNLERFADPMMGHRVRDEDQKASWILVPDCSEIDETLEFNPRLNELLLYEAVMSFAEISLETSDLMLAYMFWFNAIYWDDLTEEKRNVALFSNEGAEPAIRAEYGRDHERFFDDLHIEGSVAWRYICQDE